VLTADDARHAVDHGVDAIVVSNHGGRQLDGTLPTSEALAEVADAVRGRVELLVDGGIRRGSDIVKALALGARAVLIGRPYLWALATDGQAGVERMLALLRDEIDLCMALAGRPTIASIDRTLLAAP
jgi:4-hydroxymandelate oxidase